MQMDAGFTPVAAGAHYAQRGMTRGTASYSIRDRKNSEFRDVQLLLPGAGGSLVFGAVREVLSVNDLRQL